MSRPPSEPPWKAYPHDNGFNWDANGPEQWHEYGHALGKYHTPAICFATIEDRDAAFDLLTSTPGPATEGGLEDDVRALTEGEAGAAKWAESECWETAYVLLRTSVEHYLERLRARLGAGGGHAR